MRPAALRPLLLALCAAAFAPAARAQADTTAVADPTAAPVTIREVAPEARPSPRGAVFRSLAVPGWGQLYNGDYVKVPIAVGGLGALVYGVVRYHNRATLYRRAALYADCVADPRPVADDFCEGFEGYFDEFTDAGTPSASSARLVRDNARRNRDLLVLLSVLAYGLQALDAYVSAELADFDVSEDLSLEVLPAGRPAIGLRWRF